MNEIEQSKVLAELLMAGTLTSPPTIYCTTCGRQAVKKIKVEISHYDSLTGLPSYTIEALYKCPRFPHSLFEVATYKCYCDKNEKGKWIKEVPIYD